MPTENEITFAKLIFDIPTLRGVMVEKFKPPTTVLQGTDLLSFYWKDKDDRFHSFNGMPGIIFVIEQQKCRFVWIKHGEPIKQVEIVKKLEHEVIAEKRKIRNFSKRKK